MYMARPGNVKRQRGLTLFEILITLLVVTIGLLGLAGLQFTGLRAANSAQERTQATLLAQDIEERIRANDSSDYNLVNLAPTTANCVNNPCTPDQMRDFDRKQWYYMLNGGGPNAIVLPKASVKIQKCTASNTMKITIQWNGSNDSSDPCDPDNPTGPSTLLATFHT